MFEFIQSKDNPKIKLVRGLLEQASLRKKNAQTVLAGAHLIESFIHHYSNKNTDCKIQFLLCTESALDHPENQKVLDENTAPVYLVDSSLYHKISQLGESTPLMAVIDLPKAQDAWQIDCDTLILDRVQDPGNVGTLLRSAAAVGIHQVITTTGTASLWSPRVLRAAMGAHFSLAFFEAVQIENLIDQFQIPVYATSSHRPQSIYQLDLKTPCVWILGNEGQGVHENLLEKATAVTIPQPGGQESLNVAIAGSVCLFEMMRQRL